jgi:hypothetical protein
MAQANNKDTVEKQENNVDTTELENLKTELENSNLEKEALLKQIEELKSTVEKQENNGAYKKGSFIVYASVKNFNGIVAAVHFAYGKANVQKGWVLDWFKERGYKVEEVK